MKALSRNAKKLVKLQSRQFASGGHHELDPNTKDFEVILIGGLNSSNIINHFQHSGSHAKMALFNNNNGYFNEHHYEYLLHGTMQAYKYLANTAGQCFDNKASLFFQNKVTEIRPESNEVVDDRGKVYTYKTLILNTGLQQKAKNMEFVDKYIHDGEFGSSRVFVHEVNSIEQIERTKRMIYMHKDQDFIVYLPKYPSRREAYDAWYLGLDQYFSWGHHSQSHPKNMKVRVITPNENLFRFPFANEIVMDEIKDRQLIECHFGWEITNIEIQQGINSVNRYATFKNTKSGETMRLLFGSIVLTPENKKRDIYKNNEIADETGQVKVNPLTLQHVKYPNIFGFGDCIDADTTKSFYATLNQGVVCRTNVKNYLEGKELNGVYEGYSSFAVNHSIDRQWVFSHKYGYESTFGNFYVSRFLGLFAYKFKNILEKQFFSKIFTSKPNYGYPWVKKNRYFRSIEENKFVQKHKITRKELMPHGISHDLLSHNHH